MHNGSEPFAPPGLPLEQSSMSLTVSTRHTVDTCVIMQNVNMNMNVQIVSKILCGISHTFGSGLGMRQFLLERFSCDPAPDPY